MSAKKSIKQQLKELKKAIAELYLSIKQKTRDEVSLNYDQCLQNEIVSPEEEKEEQEIIVSLDSYVVIEYIKSSVDIILNLKFEEIERRLMDKSSNAGGNNHNESMSYKQKTTKQDQDEDKTDTLRSH